VFTNSEQIVTQNNPYYGGRYVNGGVFRLTRNIVSDTPVYVKTSQMEGTAIGGTATVPWTSIKSQYVVPSDSTLTTSGTTGFKQTIPTTPAFDLMSALGELRFGGLPRTPALWREGTLSAKNAGSDYLNAEFGWVPLVNDMRKFASAVNESDKIVNAYKQDANRFLHRTYEWPEVRTSQLVTRRFTVQPAKAGFMQGGVYERVTFKKWFEATYKYYLPVGNSQGEQIARYGSYARKLLGVGFNPEAVWNLAPWSWATDWFLNTGDIVSNIGNLGVDGVVADGAYIMQHSQYFYQLFGRLENGQGDTSTVQTIESKIRLPATPYGFGVTYNGLSPKKVAVIAALGMSRW
jgi:hypothetical protein